MKCPYCGEKVYRKEKRCPCCKKSLYVEKSMLGFKWQPFAIIFIAIVGIFAVYEIGIKTLEGTALMTQKNVAAPDIDIPTETTKQTETDEETTEEITEKTTSFSDVTPGVVEPSEGDMYETERTYKVNGDLRIRSGPGSGYDAYENVMPDGTIVKVFAEKDDWGFVFYNGNYGWSYLDYMTEQ